VMMPRATRSPQAQFLNLSCMSELLLSVDEAPELVRQDDLGETAAVLYYYSCRCYRIESRDRFEGEDMTHGRPTLDAKDRKRLRRKAALIVKLYASMGTTSIARELGAPLGEVRGVLRASGVKERSKSAGMTIRLDRAGIDGRRNLLAKARAKRLQNLRTDSSDPTKFNPAVGRGYHTVADALASRGHIFKRQVKFGPYYLDLVIDHFIVEIVLNLSNLPGRTSKRLKYLLEGSRSLLYVVFHTESALATYFDQVIAAIESTCRNPPPRGKYRVIRCHLEKGFACDDYDKRATIHGPKGAKNIISWRIT
jgi:hypothetical protein